MFSKTQPLPPPPSLSLSPLHHLMYSCLPSEPESAPSVLRNVESYCRQIKIWMMKNKLKLNERKTEVLFCGSSSRRGSIPATAFQLVKRPFRSPKW